jgi:Acetyltransferases, including N-acetylases of ribosomal proteins
MQDKYEKYYWQNDKVRLRANRDDDVSSDDERDGDLDSEMWALCSEEMVLPVAAKETRTVEEIAHNEKPPSFAIETLDGVYIGVIRFNDINERHGTFEVGLMLKGEHRNKGYGKAAMKIVLQYAFNERRLNKCNADCIDCNIASAALMKSLGFKQEGTVREAIFYGGKYHDRLIFGLTAAEYNSEKQ